MAARVTQPAVAARPARRLPRGARLRCGGDRTLVLALAGATALAFVLRVRALGESFWYDEAYSAYIAAQPALRALELIPTTESTPPLYYALAWLWTRVFGAGEVALRSLSLATGLATVLVLSLLGRELAPAGRERTAAVACALVAASSPLLAWYAGEARAYALLALLCALAALFFVRFLREPNGRWAWRYGATATAALATHYFALFVVAPQIALLLVRYRERSALPAAALPVAGALALAPLAVVQLDSRRSDWIGTLPLAGRTWHAAVHFAAGFRPPPLVAWPLVALCWGGVALVAIRPPRGSDGRAPILVRLALAGLAAALLLAFCGLDRVLTRNLLGAWPVLAAAVTAAAVAAGERWRRLVAAVLVAWCAASALLADRIDSAPSLRRPAWRAAASIVASGERPRLVLVPRYPHLLPLRVYLPHLRRAPAARVSVREIDLVAPRGSGPGCWWGALCNLPRAPLPHRPPPGFVARLRQRVSGLVVWRLVPLAGEATVAPRRVARTLAHRGPTGLFWERNVGRARPGAARSRPQPARDRGAAAVRVRVEARPGSRRRADRMRA